MTDKIKNMSIDDVVAILNDPTKSSKMTWGELIQVMDVVEKTQRIMTNQTGCAELEGELKRLKTRVRDLENIIAQVRSVFGGDCDDQG